MTFPGRKQHAKKGEIARKYILSKSGVNFEAKPLTCIVLKANIARKMGILSPPFTER